MASLRALCVTANPALRRTLRRTLQAVGSTVEFAEDPTTLVVDGGAPAAAAPELVVLDADSRRNITPERLAELLGSSTKVVMLGESLSEDAILEALRARAFDHVISDLPDPDEEELVVTSVKVLRGDIFGLEKYLAWGVLVREREVLTYDDKRDALVDLADYARVTGARRQVVSRIESVADELLMNAMYDAPAIRFGVRPSIHERTRARLGPLGDQPALLRFAADGRWLAVSVHDNYGELRKEAILDNLARARAERGSPQTDPSGRGAGLGLYFILASVTRFIANVCPGHATEVICLFDLKATGRDQEACARSLHVFTAPPPASE